MSLQDKNKNKTANFLTNLPFNKNFLSATGAAFRLFLISITNPNGITRSKTAKCTARATFSAGIVFQGVSI